MCCSLHNVLAAGSGVWLRDVPDDTRTKGENIHHAVQQRYKRKRHNSTIVFSTFPPFESNMADKEFARMAALKRVCGNHSELTLMVPEIFPPRRVHLPSYQSVNLVPCELTMSSLCGLKEKKPDPPGDRSN
ncbi:hypothetical protein JOB18_040267 [Solea senegalensis]|uniref:Uncharacterized protein n=1 Tax=Solea senegalensis TaxID=28829 RepID=A0AAV6QLN7_SOLSE|nr:hypothetical protein JOB18_040267 [Solea senegalensis]